MTRRALVQPPEMSEIDPENVKQSMQDRFLSEDGATCEQLGINEITVTWGGERFQPIQYFHVDTGPISVTIRPEPSERANQAYARAYALVEKYGKQLFESKLKEYLERVKRVAEMTERAKQ